MTTVEFQAEVNSFASPAIGADPIKIIDAMAAKIKAAEDVATQVGMDAKEISGVKNRFINEAESLWMRTRFASLDMSFAEKTQAVVVGRVSGQPDKVELKRIGDDAEDASERAIELPRYACIWNDYSRLAGMFSGDDDYRQRSRFESRSFDLPSRRIDGAHRRAINVTPSVQLPSGITPAMFQMVRNCIAYLRLFEVLIFARGYERDQRRSNGIEVGVLWAPTLDAWAFRVAPVRPKGDPAILVRSGSDQPYLVCYFDTPNEVSIENLIREFTSGVIS